MVRNIFGVIVGYLVMFLFIFITFTILYLILGAEGSFLQGSYKVSGIWIVLSIILSFIAALAGGYICVLIAKNKKAAIYLAGLVFILGIVFAIPSLSITEEEYNKVREGNVPNMEAMQQAKQPVWMAFLNPVLGVVGVLAGSKLKKSKREEA